MLNLPQPLSHFTKEAIEDFKGKEILPDTEENRGDRKRFFDEKEQTEESFQTYVNNYQEDLKEVFLSYFENGDLNESEFKEFYSLFIITKAKEFNALFLTDEDNRSKFLPHLEYLFLAYVFSAITVNFNYENDEQNHILPLIYKMNEQIKNLLVYANGQSFFHLLISENEEAKVKTLLVQHFTSTTNHIPKKKMTELLKKELRVWQSIQKDLSKIEDKKGELNVKPKKKIDDTCIDLISGFVSVQKQEMQQHMQKINEDLDVLNKSKNKMISPLECSFLQTSLKQSNQTRCDLLKSCDALTESTKEYQYKVKKQNNQLSPIDKFIDFVSSIVKSIKQKVSGKAGLATNQSSLFHNARFKTYAINNYTKENFSQFMHNTEAIGNLSELYNKLFKRKNKINFSDFASITALEIDDVIKSQLLEVARIINFIHAFVAKIRDSSEKFSNHDFVLLVSENLKNLFKNSELEKFDLKIFNQISALYSLSKNYDERLNQDLKLMHIAVLSLQPLAEMEEFMKSHIENPIKALMQRQQQIFGNTFSESVQDDTVNKFEILQKILMQNDVVLTNPDTDFQNLNVPLQTETEENINLLKQALNIIHLAHALQGKATKAGYESVVDYIQDNLGRTTINTIKNFDLDILDSIAKFIPANQANASFREAFVELKEALDIIKHDRVIEKVNCFTLN